MSFLELVANPKARVQPESSSSDVSADTDTDSDSGTSTSYSTSSPTDSDSNDSGRSEEMATMKRYMQTEKARCQRRINQLQRKVQKLEGPKHPAEAYRNDVVFGSHLTEPGHHAKTFKFRRLRLLWSWFSSFIKAIFGFVSESGSRIRHVITVCVVDDTNMRLASPYSSTSKQRSSRVVSVMNNLQSLIFNLKESDDQEKLSESCLDASYRTFLVHTPMVPLAPCSVKDLSVAHFLFSGNPVKSTAAIT